MKKYNSVGIWIFTLILHAAVYFSGFLLVLLGLAVVYIMALLAGLIIESMQKSSFLEFDKAVFIGILHTILLFFDLFGFFFLLSIETGSFHAS